MAATLLGLVAPQEAASAGSNGHLITSAVLRVRPASGPRGTRVRVHGKEFVGGQCGGSAITIEFVDANGQATIVGRRSPPEFRLKFIVPVGAAHGDGQVVAGAHRIRFFHGRPFCVFYVQASVAFRVTGAATDR